MALNATGQKAINVLRFSKLRRSTSVRSHSENAYPKGRNDSLGEGTICVSARQLLRLSSAWRAVSGDHAELVQGAERRAAQLCGGHQVTPVAQRMAVPLGTHRIAPVLRVWVRLFLRRLFFG